MKAFASMNDVAKREFVVEFVEGLTSEGGSKAVLIPPVIPEEKAPVAAPSPD